MKKLFFIIATMLIVLNIYAQNDLASEDLPKDVTKFLRIPVDGTKAEMRQKLIAKGYTLKKDRNGNEWLEGEFNGKEVRIFIVTNNNKVWRIAVMDKNYTSESEIITRYNNLYYQFKNNHRYEILAAEPIPAEEDISYEMSIHNKQYQASFIQITDEKTMNRLSDERLRKQYSEEQIKDSINEVKIDKIWFPVKYTLEMYENKSVWFRITEHFGEYGIALYYDNGYNKANGEDL